MNVMWPIVTKLDFELEQGEAPERVEDVRVAKLEVRVDQLETFQKAHFKALNILSEFNRVRIWRLETNDRS